MKTYDHHKAKEEAKRAKMKHPDWAKYSGFPPAEAEETKHPKKKAKAPEPEEVVENGDGN